MNCYLRRLSHRTVKARTEALPPSLGTAILVKGPESCLQGCGTRRRSDEAVQLSGRSEVDHTLRYPAFAIDNFIARWHHCGSCGTKGVIPEGAMMTASNAKKGWIGGTSHLALLLVLVLPVPLIARTPFETPYPYPGRMPDARSSMAQGWLLQDKIIPRQTAPAPYPDTLILVGSYETPGKARDVWVEYPLAYLASDHIGVEVIDVSDPTNPVLINTIDTPGQAFDVMAQDTLVYVADDYSGFQILNNSGIVGGYDTPEIARGISIRGDFLYVADYESLLIFDITNPTDPQHVAGFTLNELGGATAHSVFVTGSYAYIGEPIPGSCIMWIVDVSDPATPSLAGWYLDPVYLVAPYSIWVDGSLAFIANYWNELFIVDVSNPASPYLVSYATPPDSLWGFAWDVKINGSDAYVANYNGGLWVVNVSNPGSPQTSAMYDTPGLASGVFADSPYIYLADYYSLLIFERIPKGIQERSDKIAAAKLRLVQNRPNPFARLTTIEYELSDPGHVSVAVYDVAGRLVRKLVDEDAQGGVHSVEWNATGLPSGAYFCRLKVDSQDRTVRMTLVE